MFRFLIIVILLVISVAAAAWFSAQSLPSWYEKDTNQANQLSQKLTKQIEQQGVSRFLGSKFA